MKVDGNKILFSQADIVELLMLSLNRILFNAGFVIKKMFNEISDSPVEPERYSPVELKRYHPALEPGSDEDSDEYSDEDSE